jgi:hypothetical protein
MNGFRRVCISIFLCIGVATPAIACLPDSHKHLTRHCVAEPQYKQILNVIFGELANPRQIAVIAGVSEYPNLVDRLQLPPASYDVETLSDILIKRLRFDEVIVIKNNDFSLSNIKYVFENYLPDLLRSNQKSRVLFAFSGHGADFEDIGYLFFPETKTISAGAFSDLVAALDLNQLKTILAPTIRYAQHFLALINACNGGHFLDVGAMDFGGGPLDERGAHGITAGGAKDVVRSRSNVGSGNGSVFFEMLFYALNEKEVVVAGQKFESPSKGDGILTTTGLADYLSKTVQIIEGNTLSPRMGPLTRRKAGNQGEFFFVTDHERAKTSLGRRFPQEAQRVFGAAQRTDNAPVAPSGRLPGLYAKDPIPAGTLLRGEMFEMIEGAGSREAALPINFDEHVRGSCSRALLNIGDKLTWDHLLGHC